MSDDAYFAVGLGVLGLCLVGAGVAVVNYKVVHSDGGGMPKRNLGPYKEGVSRLNSAKRRVVFRDDDACKGDKAFAGLFRYGNTVEFDINPDDGTVSVVDYPHKRLTPGAKKRIVTFKDPNACQDELCQSFFRWGEYADLEVDPASGSIRYLSNAKGYGR